MNINQVKEEAKKRFDKDLTDQQAQAFLEAHPTGELREEELADVAGGGEVIPGGRLRCATCGWEIPWQECLMGVNPMEKHKESSPNCTCFKPRLFIGFNNPVDDSWLVE